MYRTNTICAISTALSRGAISIVRLSGPNAFTILNKIFVPKNKNRYEKFRSHSIYYGSIVTSDKILDDVLVTIMKAPNTYTGEDMVEVNCHGGVYVTKEVLELMLLHGASLAEAGEFTRRAFFNNKLDLTQAEATFDLIYSETKTLKDTAIKEVKGSLSYYISSLKSELLSIISNVEVNIDYPEYDIEEVTYNDIIEKLSRVDSNIKSALKTADTGKIIREGIRVSIVGKPNVGKSSLLNRLLKEERAIVTDIPGTTRDTVEELITLSGIPILLIDTAGIRDTDDEVEKIGVIKSKDALSESDLILCMFDASRDLSDEDREILELTKNKNRIVILNKSDLENKIDRSLFDDYIELSIINDEGISALEDKITEMFNLDSINTDRDLIITNERHKDSLNKASFCINKALDEAKIGVPQDLIAITIKDALENLYSITGENVSEEIINEIFHKFCVGK